METLIIQFGTSLTGSLSVIQQIVIWGFVILFIGFFIFFFIKTDRIIRRKNHLSDFDSPQKSDGRMVTDEEAAAIALAINMYKRDLHDMESFTITLKKVSRIYSPWSSKIYTLRQNPK